MNKRHHISAVIALSAVLAALIPTTIAGASLETRAGSSDRKAASASSSCWTWRSPERSFARKHNNARKRRGLVPLQLDRHLGRVARKHTSEMTGSNDLFHTPSSLLGNRVTRWLILGENVGVGSTVDSLFTAFMNSPSHKANILYSKFRYFGVGTRRVNGRLWVTVIFESRNNPGTTLRMPSC